MAIAVDQNYDKAQRKISTDNLAQFAGVDCQLLVEKETHRPVIMDGSTLGGKFKCASTDEVKAVETVANNAISQATADELYLKKEETAKASQYAKTAQYAETAPWEGIIGIKDASTSEAGIIPLATQASVIKGVDNTSSITPMLLANNAILYSKVQALTDEQKQTARTNIGAIESESIASGISQAFKNFAAEKGITFSEEVMSSSVVKAVLDAVGGAYIVEQGKTNDANPIYYTVWSNGFKEQSSGASYQSGSTIVFPVEFNDSNYSLVGPGVEISGAGRQYVSKNTTGFSISNSGGQVTCKGWYACGY